MLGSNASDQRMRLNVKRSICLGVLVVCSAMVSPAMAHPGHGKPMDSSRSEQIVRHYFTEPIHLLSTAGVIVMAIAFAYAVIEERRPRSERLQVVSLARACLHANVFSALGPAASKCFFEWRASYSS